MGKKEEPIDLQQGFKLVMWGLGGLMLWLPTSWGYKSCQVVELFHLAGAVLLYCGCLKLVSVGPRFPRAMFWSIGAGAAALLMLAMPVPTPVQIVMWRTIMSVSEWSYFIAYAIWLGAIMAVVWNLSGALIEAAQANANITLRDSAAGHRDLFLAWILTEGMRIGVLPLMMSMRWLSVELYRIFAWIIIGFGLLVMLMWMRLAARAGEGFDPDAQVLDEWSN